MLCIYRHDKALLWGWLTGALWTAARAHARGLRATPLCPYCSRQQEEDDEHILWACPAWGIHRSGAWRSLMRTARALGLSDQISSWPTCLRICGLMPEHLSHGIPKGQVHDFMYGFHSMVLQILRAPSPAWSPAVTSSWHSVRHVFPEHWSPACTPGGGSDRQQDSPHLPPVLLAPLFESAMSTPRRDSTQSASDEDVQQYAVRCSTPPDLPPTPLAPLFESVMSASRADSTHLECDEDMGQYEVQYSTPPSVGEWPPNPFTFPSLRGAQRLCTELPGMARQGQGWVRDPHARHSTMLYSMQEGALSSNSAEGLMKHGRASREAT